jgi:hypothetical protein
VRGLCGDQYLSASPKAGQDQSTVSSARGVVCPPRAE